MWKWIILLSIFIHVLAAEELLTRNDLTKKLNVLRSKTSLQIQEKAAISVINRTLPSHHHLFRVELFDNIEERNEKNQRSFELVKNDTDSQVLIRATDGISACKGFYYYLKYYLNLQVSWSGVQLSNIPDYFPTINYKYATPSAHLYHQNVCTWGYSFTWWQWSDWRKHIDWMALMGISLTIAPIQEAIWSKVYNDLGLTKNEVDDHFSGPAFLPWQRMGNLRGWSGPLPNTYKLAQLELQKQILAAQRDLGMTVAIPGFAGLVPVGMKRLFPNSTMEPASRWNHFPDEYASPLFIDPNEKLFKEIGSKFLREVIKEYGTDHLYFSDPFNEMQPKQIDPEYMAKTSASIYSSMSDVDSKAVWLLQGWFIVQNKHWSEEILRSFLTAVPQGNLLVLDLQSETTPQYVRTKSYYGQPFIWCMLHNFGGTLGMHGSIDIVNSEIGFAQTMVNSSMIGVGITQEGINQNYLLYEFALERGWYSSFGFNVTLWFKSFLHSRYGIEDDNAELAWQKIKETVYSYENKIQLHGYYTVAIIPSKDISPWIWYDANEFVKAWKFLLKTKNLAFDNELFQHDVVDVTRQFLQIAGDSIFISMMDSFKRKNVTSFNNLGKLMLDVLDDMEQILRSSRFFLLGNWLESAKQMATTELEKEIFEVNARNQITLWGPNGEIRDYATKQWSGIVVDYFKPRWELFISELQSSLNNDFPFDESKYFSKVFRDIESPFSVNRKLYPTEAIGNTIKIAQQIYNKWINRRNLNLTNIPVKKSLFDFPEYDYDF